MKSVSFVPWHNFDSLSPEGNLKRTIIREVPRKSFDTDFLKSGNEVRRVKCEILRFHSNVRFHVRSRNLKWDFQSHQSHLRLNSEVLRVKDVVLRVNGVVLRVEFEVMRANVDVRLCVRSRVRSDVSLQYVWVTSRQIHCNQESQLIMNWY